MLFGISLEINAGECVVLLGRNGVGKTTTMRSVMGLTPPSSGRVRWKGQDITGWPSHKIARAGIGFVPEDRRIFAELTVWENLDVAGRAGGRRGHWTIETVYELFPVLRELRNFRQGGASVGRRAADADDRAHPGWAIPNCCCSTSRRRGWRRWLVETLRVKVGELVPTRA